MWLVLVVKEIQHVIETLDESGKEGQAAEQYLLQYSLI
jgi:hypothetical protein